MNIPSFLDHLKTGKILVSDGATGSNLLARGLPRDKSSEAWLFDNPDEIVRLHREFIQAGADIILTNTFGGSPLRLKETGLGGQVEAVNHTAVELARRAIGGQPVMVAGSLGPVGGLMKPFGLLEEEQVYNSYKEQASALTEANADLLVIETQFAMNEAILAVKATRSVSSLPLVCSFSYDRGVFTMMGVKPKQMAEAITPLGVDVLGVNCGRSLDENLRALIELRAATDLPIWFKPNAGLPKVDPLGGTTYDFSPEEMGALASQWIEAGAQIVGGCCGTSPVHLAQIVKAVKS